MSKGEQEICLIHIDDIINAIMISINNISNLTGYNPYSLLNKKTTYILKDLAYAIKKICGSHSEIDTGFYEYRKNEILHFTSRYNQLPEWKPSISLNEGISEIYKLIV